MNFSGFGPLRWPCTPLEVKLAHLNVFTADEDVLQRLNVRRYPMFIIAPGLNGLHQSYFPHGFDFLRLSDSVLQVGRPLKALLSPETARNISAPSLTSYRDLLTDLHGVGLQKPRVVRGLRQRHRLLPGHLWHLPGGYHDLAL